VPAGLFLLSLIQDEVPWCKLFADNVVLLYETRHEFNANLKFWRDVLEFKALG
jgi:hypothetical protein